MPEQKEREPVVEKSSVEGEKKGGIVEGKNKKRVPEIDSVVEKIERKYSDKNQVVSDASDDVSGSQPVSDQPAVTVPVTRDDVAVGSKMPVSSSFRWLVAWVVRQIKKFKGRVVFKKNGVKE